MKNRPTTGGSLQQSGFDLGRNGAGHCPNLRNNPLKTLLIVFGYSANPLFHWGATGKQNEAKFFFKFYKNLLDRPIPAPQNHQDVCNANKQTRHIY